jgi:ketosteroid isomerase-like protein
MSQENVEIVRAALEAFARGDVDEALQRVHPDMVSRRIDPDGAEFHGRDGLLALMADWGEGFAEWRYRAEEFIDAGDKVVVRLFQWGTGAESGVPVSGDYWLTYDFVGGYVTRFTIYADREQAFEAVGLKA